MDDIKKTNFTINGKAILGHGPEFKYIFSFLITEAVKIGIWKYIDYSKNLYLML